MQVRGRSGAWWMFGFLLTWCLLAATSSVAQPAQGSLRLVIEPERGWVVAGHTIKVNLRLHDAHNQPSAAPSDLVIELVVTPPVVGAASTVTIPAGQSVATVELQPSKPGILEIRARHPQAFDGGAFVRVALHAPPAKRARLDESSAFVRSVAHDDSAAKPTGPLRERRPRAPGAAATGAPTSRPSPSPPAPLRVAPAAPPVATAVAPPQPKPSPPPSPMVIAPLRATAPSPTAVASPAVAAPPPEATAPSTSGPRLTLRYSPQRKLLADGQDAVTIQAFVVGDDSEPAATTNGDIKVTLFASSGTLVPQPLVIQEGGGRSMLTSDQAGDVDIEFVRAQPDAKLDGDRHLHIHFGAPIHALRLEAKPASFSLVDETDLVVTLLDAGGRAVATDAPFVVSLALDAGRGEIVHKDLTLKPGEFEARTRFVPTGVSEVAVSASASSLLNQVARFEVRLPLGLLIVSVIGGLVGGLLAFLRRRGTGWPRIAVGGVTGFLLYWAFMFGLVRVLPPSFVLNPLSNFALSTIGGWLGTEVFSLLLGWLGLNKPDARKEGDADKPAPSADHAPATGRA
jgi:hypothetical protein